MSVKTYILAKVAQSLTSEARVMRNRVSQERKRIAQEKSHIIEYFHQADDPYSHLMVQVLTELPDKYDIQIIPYLVSPPTKEAAPELEKLNSYALTDAERLAAKLGLSFTNNAQLPSDDAVTEAQSALAKSIIDGCFFENVIAIGTALWRGEDIPDAGVSSGDLIRHLEMNNAARAKRGHYLGATLYYAGEWYWGLDRLHYLEERLRSLGAYSERENSSSIYQPNTLTFRKPVKRNKKLLEIDFFFSFRSPYSYISFQRTCELADAYNAQLNLRFVLPMVMRGLPVPRVKRFYILNDAAREARNLNVPFGLIADPLGEPVLRGYSLLPWAIEQGKGRDYCQSFMRAVWSEGIDAKLNKGLRSIVEAAGLPWDHARELIGNEDWKPIEEHNRTALERLNLWGVPSYSVNGHAIWGQDRLWAVEDALKSTCETHQD
jgi:2-hydroxychromene-2-carboxylate isomerase